MINTPSSANNGSPTTPKSGVFQKKKFRLGFGSMNDRSDTSRSRINAGLVSDDEADLEDHPVLITTTAIANGIATSIYPSATNGSVSNVLQSPSANNLLITGSPKSNTSSLEVEEMNIDLNAAAVDHNHNNNNNNHTFKATPKRRVTQGPTRSSSRPNFRFIQQQWGPWTVSVAETPNDSLVYNVYIKTPTHNYTLTRNQKEIVDLHAKLRDSYPNTTLPPFPLAYSPGEANGGGKRRSSFLHTLSRFTSNSNNRPGSAGGPPPLPTSSSNASTVNGGVPSSSPSADPVQDPFATATVPDQQHQEGHNVVLGLSEYFTTVSNDPKIRSSKIWKRFIRVRADDLESERVERAIKRVRSDLTKHQHPTATNAQTISGRLDDHLKPLTLGPSFGSNIGLSPEGGFQSEVEESASELPSKTTSDVDVTVQLDHQDKRSSVVKDKRSSVGYQDKRLSAILAAVSPSSAFSSDSGMNGDIQGPPTPTPGTTELKAEPENIELPPSPTHIHDELDSSSKPKSDIDAEESAAEGDVTTTDAASDAANRKPKKSKSKGKLKPKKKVCVEDFEMMRVLGKGCAGKVLLVKYRKSGDLYALKAITKRHVLAHQELQHTLTEQAVLKRMSRENKDPFVVKLWWSFHDRDNLFLVMDFHPGGDLATQLARWGRLGRDRARFYAAEIVEGVDGLHAAGVIYRDLKPENILIGADGHIVLTDFGLSKEFPRKPHNQHPEDFYSSAPGTPTRQMSLPHWMSPEDNAIAGMKDLTSTFCGTAEYLAPEVIQGLPYSYEVDWWSFGTMLYEMLSGITPFWANNHSDMYVRVLQDELQFPDDRAMDQDTKSLIRGLLQRNPALRMSEPRIKRHPYFSMIDWDHVYYKRYIPPYIPPIDPSNASDTQNFDEAFLEMQPVIDDNEVSESDHEKTEDEAARAEAEEQPTSEVVKTEAGEQVTAVAAESKDTASVDVFDGYSFKGRHSILIDDEDYEAYADEEGGDDDELVEARKVTDALAAMHDGATPTGDRSASDNGTIEQENRPPTSITPTTLSIPPESAITASISTESESMVSPKAHVAQKQGSGFSEGTVPSLTTATTASSSEWADSPTTGIDASLIRAAAAARALSEGSAVYDDPAYAPLPLSPVLEAEDVNQGYIVEEVDDLPPSNVYKPASPVRERVHLDPTTPVPNRNRAARKERTVVDREDATEREEDDWDLVEAPHGEDRNGAKGLSLWQRGVVDRYKLAVFRKSGSTSQSSSRAPRAVSGANFDSTSNVYGTDSPTPSENKYKRGRTVGKISLRKSTRDFLRAKSPGPNFSAQSSAASRTSLAVSHSNAATLSTNSTGLLSPSSSAPIASRTVPSLKSKSSALSKVSANSPPSSDQSATDLRNHPSKSMGDVSYPQTPIKSPLSPKTPTSGLVSEDGVMIGANNDVGKSSNMRKMKKYTEQAEKMFSLFSSPRHQPQ